MSVVGEVRVVPQAMSQLYEELVRVRMELKEHAYYGFDPCRAPRTGRSP